MLSPCLSSPAGGVHSQNPLCSHHFQSLSRSSISTLLKSNPKSSPTSATHKPLQKRKLSLVCCHSELPEQQQWISFSNSPSSSVQPAGRLPPKVFVGYSIYKGKAALSVSPQPPEYSRLDSGAFKLSKDGFVSLQFAPASGVRQYDWGKKQLFSLSVTELGSLISLGPKESCDFFHDPNKGRSDEGKVRKLLKIEPLPDGSGHFFNLSVQNKLNNTDESIYIPVTRAEFTVLVSAFNFILPYLLGWHTCLGSFVPEEASRVNSANPKSDASFEWQR
ncbi:unnamed protein product [Cuscuta campestris]|uniref:Single-stranded DNA-binding protein WHY1, chloroplastic n=1 Tax=Cuscuta campestris TaxID=132261 RepID=A0A484KX35_9ASTE|nr:unnamed protein product [Cuscuta campestris]